MSKYLVRHCFTTTEYFVVEAENEDAATDKLNTGRMITEEVGNWSEITCEGCCDDHGNLVEDK